MHVTFFFLLFFPRYSIRSIDRHFQKFLSQNSIPSTSFLPTIFDENEYLLLRRQVLAISTASEHARTNRIASQMDYSQINTTIDLLVKAKLLRRRQKEKSTILHYKSNIHKLWNVSFPIVKCIDSKLIVGTRNNSNLIKELVRRRPLKRKRQAGGERPRQ